MSQNLSIAFTAYHLHLLRLIDERRFVIDFSPLNNPFQILKNYLTLVTCVVKLKKNETEVILPHPFNPAGLLVFLMCRNLCVVDDGVALYNSAKLPDKFSIKIYQFVLYVKFKIKIRSFSDILLLPVIKKVYAVYPERVVFESSLRSSALLIAGVKNKADKKFDLNPVNKILVLDTNSADYSICGINVDAVVNVVNCLALKNNLDVVVKTHPSEHKSTLVQCGFDELEVMGDIIDCMEKFNYKIVIGYLSTGLITLKNSYPDIRVISLVSKESRICSEKLIEFFLDLGIEVVGIE